MQAHRRPATPRRKPRRQYHHGDLKSALVAAAVEILRTRGPAGLTLRAVAAATGVTAAATYRHFSDRRELIAAVATVGFDDLRRAMLDGARTATGRSGLKQVALAYIRFAHDHPAEYRIMFGPEVADATDLPGLREAGSRVLAFVAEGIARLQSAGLVREGDAARLAVITWAALHGLVMLSLDGQTASVGASRDALAEEMTQLMMFGLARRDSV